MTQGISIHIGLNRVDPAAYNGWNGQLAGCVNDATAMQAIAQSCGYQSTLLLNEQATAAAVTEALGRAAQQLMDGDLLLLTYSGHGGQIPDVNGDEDDGLDETWVLFDRMLIDDELYQLWSHFSAGVRIFMLSDSCHSGTVAKALYYSQLPTMMTAARDVAGNATIHPHAYRAIPQDVQRAVYAQQQTMYNALQWLSGRGDRAMIDASILLISGCQDNQLSGDGDQNGLFTGTLLQVWDNGAYQGSYYQFWKEILALMPATQSPNYYTVGMDNSAFADSRPFVFADQMTPPTDGTAPAIQGPTNWSRTEGAPTFQVNAGPGRYYIVELTTQPELFDITNHGDERTDDNFYGSWSDTPHLSAPTYTPSDERWHQLAANADTIYYRIGTTTSATGWDDYTVSTGDEDGWNAPSIQVIGDRQFFQDMGRQYVSGRQTSVSPVAFAK
ncbi:MAG: caspase family protein [Caldilinea sp. CFX5]|nr:caspase family protein [Caldilinea sp. CFX5]